MRRLLIPIDFSKYSISALEYASLIAKKTKAELHIIHVIEIPEMATVFPMSNDWVLNDINSSSDVHQVMALMEEAKGKMESLKASDFLKGVRLIDSIEMGNTEYIINSAASRFDIDMIIMGTRGNGANNDFYIGSNVEKLVKFNDKPILSIKTNPHKLPENIIFASNFEEEASSIFPFIQHFASVFNAKIKLLKINTAENFETSSQSSHKIEKFLRRNSIPDMEFIIYNDMMTESGIINYVDEINGDIVAIGTHGRQSLNHIFSSSITEDILSHCSCPVLTVNFKKKNHNIT